MKRATAYCLLVVLVSCTSATYVTLGATVHSVDLAMTAWGEYVYRNPCTVQDPPQPSNCASKAKRQFVSDAFEKYQKARRAAVLIVQLTDKSPTPEDVLNAADAVISLIEAFTSQKFARDAKP